jgi:hypothetical protein
MVVADDVEIVMAICYCLYSMLRNTQERYGLFLPKFQCGQAWHHVGMPADPP